MHRRNLREGFPNFTILKMCPIFPKTSCESEQDLSKLTVIKTQILISHVRGKTNFSFSSLTTENITKSLPREEQTEE